VSAPRPEIEFRDYRIRPGAMDAWIAAWRSGVAPVREAAGFHVSGAWVDRGTDRFIWVLEYSGTDGFDAANERYYASQERVMLWPEPSELIDEACRVKVDRASP
jgi:hypothetical protein